MTQPPKIKSGRKLPAVSIARRLRLHTDDYPIAATSAGRDLLPAIDARANADLDATATNAHSTLAHATAPAGFH